MTPGLYLFFFIAFGVICYLVGYRDGKEGE